MKFDRERAKPIEPVSEAQLRRGLGYMHGISGSRIAILSDDDASYVQVGGSGVTCCLEWRDMKRRRHFRAYQQPPVVPWPGVTRLPISNGDLSLRQEEYFRIDQVTEAFLAFFHRQPFPDYVQWRDVTDDLVAAGCTEFIDGRLSGTRTGRNRLDDSPITNRPDPDAGKAKRDNDYRGGLIDG